jgi:regulator of cell morphogenesis and NO signaling
MSDDTIDRALPIDTAWSVNELLRRHPSAVVALNAFGVDTCCGGAVPLRDAAREQGIDLASLVAALRSTVILAGNA